MKRKRDTSEVYRVKALIYLYECVNTESEYYGWKYVGQTIQSMDERHKQHLYGKIAKFDKILRADPNIFEHRVIENTSFESSVETNEDKAKLLADAHIWLNKREKFWIKHYDSYSNKGFNRDSGGQKGRNQKFFEAWLLDRELMWKQRFFALETYHAENGHTLIPALYRFPKNHVSERLRGYKVGQCAAIIRAGHTVMDASHREKLNSIGFVWSIQEYHKQLRWDAFEAYYKEHGDLVPAVSYCFPKTHADKRLRGYKIGQKVDSIRAGKTTVTDEEKQRLKQMGFLWNVDQHEQAKRMDALRAYYEEHHDLMVSQSYRFPKDHADKRFQDYPLGNVVSAIRSKTTRISTEDEQEFKRMNFVWNTRDFNSVLRMKALRVYKKEHNNLLVPQSFKFSDEHRIVELRGYKLGLSVASIRAGKTKLSDSTRSELSTMGFVWNTLLYNRQILWAAIRAYYQEHNNLTVPYNFQFSETHDDERLRGYSFGARLSNAKHGGVRFSEAEQETLAKMGFLIERSYIEKHARV